MDNITYVSKREFDKLRQKLMNIQVFGADFFNDEDHIVIQIPETISTGSGTKLNIAKIQSKIENNTYYANIYTNIDKAAIETSAIIKVLAIATGSTIPADTLLPCWKQEWGTAGNEATYWTVDLARFY
jgi:hypothetical protein